MGKTEPGACPLCGESHKMKRPRELYGRKVCRRCWTRFINRRQLAYVVDVIVLIVVAGAIGAAVAPDPAVDPHRTSATDVVAWVLYVLFSFKDGFAGQSPGKALFGIRVVDETSGEPIGFAKSFARNMVLLIPFFPIVVALLMNRGPRPGDGIAKTRVIWKAHASNPVFAPPGKVADVFE